MAQSGRPLTSDTDSKRVASEEKIDYTSFIPLDILLKVDHKKMARQSLK